MAESALRFQPCLRPSVPSSGNKDANNAPPSRFLTDEYRLLDTGDVLFDVPITDEANFPCVWAYSATDDTNLNTYHRYNRGFLQTTFYTTECSPGEHTVSDGNISTCELCQAGQFCPDRKNVQLCEPGTYADRRGLLACISCDNSPNVGCVHACVRVSWCGRRLAPLLSPTTRLLLAA